MNVEQRIAMERKLVAHLCATMRKHGWIPVSVYDGGETVRCKNDEEILDNVFGVDESTIHFKNAAGVRHGVFIVLGNDGWDSICDYGYSENDDFQAIMEAHVDTFAEKLEVGEA